MASAAEIAHTLSALCRAFGKEYTDVFVDHFVSIVGDPTVKVRRAFAEDAYLLDDSLLDSGVKQSPNL